jgi:hypothetical protein
MKIYPYMPAQEPEKKNRKDHDKVSGFKTQKLARALNSMNGLCHSEGATLAPRVSGNIVCHNDRNASFRAGRLWCRVI